MERSENEWTIATHFSIKKSQETIVSNKKQISEEYIKYDFTYILF